ncbi:universal stress protein [Umezawaea endophytica]|uniref:Universal stress protein n=1 Tax=Umezawaea endophytica TaxID=1654476 RepID=A0A9X2VVP0_9PSEU|nr:universal stress protein [Umezawaea endophytica]MCS7483693.1 universal stress protein [Umezawaea endophytica]
MSGPKPIVVGVDGSDEAERALGWALDEALLRGCGVRAVHAWVFEPLGDTAPTALREAARWATVKLARAVAAVVNARGKTPPIEQLAVEGGPAEVLLRYSHDAALLVVATHRGERLRKAVLGSVSDACVRRAAVPVVVLPAGATVPTG